MFDYSKYENATRKQILNALTLAEKRAQRLEFQVKENKAFFNFLQKKLKYDEPTEETKEALINPESLPQYTSHEQLVKELQAEIKAENANT